MSDSRQAILAALRRQHLPAVPLPHLGGNWQRFTDPLQRFFDVSKTVGGTATRVKDLSELRARISELDVYASARIVVSLVTDVGRVDLDPRATAPHDFEPVDVAILSGGLAVAENGAVWVTDTQLPVRALCFLAQHLILVVKTSALVHSLNEAYERIQPEQHTYGTFISGPSKTADIEQALVMGAHGPRSLHVFLVDA